MLNLNIQPAINIFPNQNIKLVIQINCYNEEGTLAQTISELPTKLEGVDKIEIMIVDDGSADNTVEIAKLAGVEHIVRHAGNKGLPAAVNTGVKHALKIGADILVNLDADNQYQANDIQKLIEPIINQSADFVYGERPIYEISEFSTIKKHLQTLGALVVSMVAGEKLTDAASGFRAMNRITMQNMLLLSDYASPLENIIQAKHKKLNVKTVSIRVNPSTRPSRLFKSKTKYIIRSSKVILDNLLLYKSSITFATIGVSFFVLGILTFSARLALKIFMESEDLHLSLLIASICCMIFGMQFIIFALTARINKANRKILEEIFVRQNINIYENSYSKKPNFID
jgi:glycosyltransferase involved in cell wall biosynthesis